MRFSDIQLILSKLIPARLPVLVQGPPGVGKTALVDGICKSQGYDLIASHPVIDEPIDYKGLPFAEKGQARWLPYGTIKQLIEAKNKTVWLIDDLGQAPLAVQAALMQWIHKDSRVLNGYKLSDCVSIVACTNRRGDRAGVSGFLEPVKSRFATILELTSDHNEWSEWAISKGLPTTLVAFLNFKPGLLSKPDPNADLTQSPSPRGWESVALLEKTLAGLPDLLLLKAMEGAVGEGPAAEYQGFIRVFHELPDFEAIVRRPGSVVVPREAHTLYALCGMLAQDVDQGTMDAVIKYAERMPREFQVVLVKFISKLNPTMMETRGYVKWATSHQLLAAA